MKVGARNYAFFGILEANDGNIWVGSIVNGVCRNDGNTNTDSKSKEG